jgi:hypothetical protein
MKTYATVINFVRAQLPSDEISGASFTFEFEPVGVAGGTLTAALSPHDDSCLGLYSDFSSPY